MNDGVKDDRAVWSRVFRKNSEVVCRKILDEFLLVPVSGDLAGTERIFSLNGVAGFVWDALDGEKNLAEVRQGMVGKFDAPGEIIGADLLELMNDFQEAGLITHRPA